MSHPPAAVAMGDQMHSAMFDRALTQIRETLAVQELVPDEDGQLYMEIGVGAGVWAAMKVLVEMGLLQSVEDDE